jgi:hypothetical protein
VAIDRGCGDATDGEQYQERAEDATAMPGHLRTEPSPSAQLRQRVRDPATRRSVCIRELLWSTPPLAQGPAWPWMTPSRSSRRAVVLGPLVSTAFTAGASGSALVLVQHGRSDAAQSEFFAAPTLRNGLLRIQVSDREPTSASSK